MDATAIEQMGSMEDDSGSFASGEEGGDQDFGDEGHDFGDEEGTSFVHTRSFFCFWPAVPVESAAAPLRYLGGRVHTGSIFYTALSSPRSPCLLS